jgi:hypothetical protein
MAPAAVLEREVCASVAEYVRALEGAFPEALTGGPLKFLARAQGAEVEIELSPQAPRVIGGLTLPLLTVRLRFVQGSAEAHSALLTHMDRAMQRGGG